MQDQSQSDFWSISQLYEAFIQVYADYPVKFNPTPEGFRIRLSKLNLDKYFTATYMSQEKIAGFILYTINDYQSKKTAYNGGTGVLPQFRGKGVIDYLFDKSLDKLRNAGAQRILLEVIDSNAYAIKLYERLEFEYTRTLKSYKKKKASVTSIPKILLKKSRELKSEYRMFKDFETSFLDSDHQLPFNLTNELIVEAYVQNELAGYIIYQPHAGRISQLAVGVNHRGKKLATALISYAEVTSSRSLTILNIPESELQTIAALEALGFVNELNQFEMELLI
jgi:ribosomal protein S18 acetylase RimI-like enzyme